MPELELIADGLSFPEGPAFDTSGKLYWTNMGGKSIGVITPGDETWSVFVETGGSPNGCNFDADGTLYIADAGVKSILTATTEGELSVFLDECEGEPLAGPNDLVFDEAGNFYFTDPSGSSAENPVGVVYYCKPSGETKRVADGLAFPNGLTLTADGKTMIVVETLTHKLVQYDVQCDGSLGEQRDWATLHEGGVGADGIALAEDGNLYVTHFGRGVIAVINPEGEIVDEFPAGGEKPTNVAFGGPDFDELFITETETNAIYRVKPGVRGEKLFPDRD